MRTAEPAIHRFCHSATFVGWHLSYIDSTDIRGYHRFLADRIDLRLDLIGKILGLFLNALAHFETGKRID